MSFWSLSVYTQLQPPSRSRTFAACCRAVWLGSWTESPLPRGTNCLMKNTSLRHWVSAVSAFVGVVFFRLGAVPWRHLAGAGCVQCSMHFGRAWSKLEPPTAMCLGYPHRKYCSSDERRAPIKAEQPADLNCILFSYFVCVPHVLRTLCSRHQHCFSRNSHPSCA